jgi:hypothetical protein
MVSYQTSKYHKSEAAQPVTPRANEARSGLRAFIKCDLKPFHITPMANGASKNVALGP